MDNLDTLTQLGKRITYLRETRHMSLLDLSVEAGVSLSYLSELEHGKRNASVKTLEKVASALKVTLSDLFLGVTRV